MPVGVGGGGRSGTGDVRSLQDRGDPCKFVVPHQCAWPAVEELSQAEKTRHLLFQRRSPLPHLYGVGKVRNHRLKDAHSHTPEVTTGHY